MVTDTSVEAGSRVVAVTLGSLLWTAARMTADHQAGVEKGAALVTSVFLYGTHNRAGPDPAQG
jgi:hypothetical protein